MSEIIVKKINNDYEIEIKTIEPDPGEDVEIVYLFQIKTFDESKFKYLMAFSGTVMAVEIDGRPMIKDPLEDAIREAERRLRRGEHRDLKLIRGRYIWFEPYE